MVQIAPQKLRLMPFFPSIQHGTLNTSPHIHYGQLQRRFHAADLFSEARPLFRSKTAIPQHCIHMQWKRNPGKEWSMMCLYIDRLKRFAYMPAKPFLRCFSTGTSRCAGQWSTDTSSWGECFLRYVHILAFDQCLAHSVVLLDEK